MTPDAVARGAGAATPFASSGRLVENIVHFVRILRAAGLPVGPARVLDHVLERGFRPLPGAADILAGRNECPSGGQPLLVAERLELTDGLPAEVDGLLCREGRGGDAPEPSQLAGGSKLHDAIAQSSCELRCLFLSDLRITEVSAVDMGRRQVEQQFDAPAAARLRERDRTPKQLGRRVPVSDPQ